MNVLFVHQNFPGQYLHLAARLVADRHRVVAIAQHRHPVGRGIEQLIYAPDDTDGAVHPYVIDLDDAIRSGLAVARQCEALKQRGFTPDVVLGHTGWGETAFIKDVWPHAPILGYFEFFYRATRSDMDFDPEFPPSPDTAYRLRARNAISLMGLDTADHGITPTLWQRDQYPDLHRARLTVIHEGIDTETVRPDPHACIWLDGNRAFRAGDEVFTFSARNLEPYRGFHVFMRALPEILRRRPNAHCLIVGGDDVSYGRPPAGGGTWRQAMLAELGHRIDPARVHFLGTLPYAQYLAVLQLSAAHIYLTYPFVLSWSLLEALAAGCNVVASRTPPVEEIITDGQNATLVDFFDTRALAALVCNKLRGRHGEDAAAMRASARATVLDRYDLQTSCLPAQLSLMSQMAGVPTGAKSGRLGQAPGVAA